MRRAEPRQTTSPAATAGNAPGMQPAGAQPDLLRQEGNPGNRGQMSLKDLPQDVLESIVRRTIEGESPTIGAIHLARLQRVDRHFKAVAKSVQNSRDQQEVGREATREQIYHLARHSTLEEFEEGMRSIVKQASNVGIELHSMPDQYRATALEVLKEQTHLHSLDLEARSMPDMAQDVVAAMQSILQKNPEMHHAALNLHNCGLKNEHVVAMANSAEFKSLTSLSLGNNEIDAHGVAALANSENMAALRSLNLEGNRAIGDEGTVALADSRHLQLRSLDLGGCNIGDNGVMALANSEMAKSLTTIGLQINNFSIRGLEALAASGNMANLTSLNLRQNRINADGASVLANSPNLKSLTSLDLERNTLGDEGLIVLASSRNLESLESLRVGLNNIGDRGLTALANSEMAWSLTSLSVRANNITDAGAHALVDCEGLAGDTRIDLMGNFRISGEGMSALRDAFEDVRV